MKEKDELVAKIKETLGVLPGNTLYLLNVLVHEDLIEYTKDYIRTKDVASRCTEFKEPWSCAKEAEAMYENIKFGWLGGAQNMGVSEWWCDNCRKRAANA